MHVIGLSKTGSAVCIFQNIEAHRALSYAIVKDMRKERMNQEVPIGHAVE